MTQPSPQELADLMEAARILIHRLPEGARLVAERPPGKKKAAVVYVGPDGKRTRYEGK